MNEERRCSDCKFDKEDDDFPNCQKCFDVGSGFEPKDEPPEEDTRKIDESNCWACMFTRGECDPCITKLQTECAGLKQELKALHDKNVELERQLKKAKDKYETLVVSLTKSQLKPSDNQPSGERINDEKEKAKNINR